MFCYCYDDKQIIAAVYSFDYCSLITVLFHMIFKINISQDFDVHGIPHALQGKVGNQADKGFDFKNMKYKAICHANRFSFKPIVFESNGYAHPETVKFIKIRRF